MTSMTAATTTGASTVDGDTVTVLTVTGYDSDNATTSITDTSTSVESIDTTLTRSTTQGWSSAADLTTQFDDVTTVETTPVITTQISNDLTTRDVQITTWDSMTTAVAKQDGGLTSGAVAGIVIAVLLLVVILMAFVWILTKGRKKTPLLRVHYKNKDSYYYQENSICRDSMTSIGEGGAITIEMQNPVCYDAYLPNGNTKYKAGEEGVSRPPSLSAHEDALMFTMAQTNNNATLVQKESDQVPKDENGGHRVSNGSAPRDSLGVSSLLGGSGLLEEIMDTVDSMQHESDAESCEKRSIASTEASSVNTEPAITSTPEKVKESSDKEDDHEDAAPGNISTNDKSLHAEDVQETVIADLESDSPDEIAL
ncbi:hypothetical protein CAPTEDRAFT_225973 [Capitella teleta]|uniref:Uncharacterized protein n=1 Tax=Capitella teleta TaxID=283909 RepID=R7TX11_CAPTE|nr:hypothetical protein CAPTEDRAFT_225973 [Capitella teleta]|eukprot:ELT98142.1 hypothetical protein CAPTEDRAFT_225973 [Capitella teleta]